MLGMTLLSYSDMGTDVLVARQLISSGDTRWGIASASCVGLGIALQSFFALVQYSRHGYKKCSAMVLAGVAGFLPLVQAWEVFVGNEQSELDLLPPTAMLAIVKGIEVRASVAS
jgi:hypothetical protein